MSSAPRTLAVNLACRDLSWEQAGPKFHLLAEQLERELAQAEESRATNARLLDEALQRIHAVRPEGREQEWISVTKQMPPDAEKVLVCWSDGWRFVGYRLGGQWLNQHERAMPNQDITHWMPFPHAPLPQSQSGSE